MPLHPIGDTVLYYTTKGAGEPVVLIHGSWGDHRDWSRVVDSLAERFLVISYDRRGHSKSGKPKTQGSPVEDADDLAALLTGLRCAPAHVAANSWGGIVGLHFALKYPQMVRSLMAHEPPLFDLLKGDERMRGVYEKARREVNDAAALLAEGKSEEGARQFVETAVSGPGGWERFPANAKKTFIRNAHTFLDEMRSPGELGLPLHSLDSLRMPVLLTCGTESPSIYAPIVDMLARHIPSVRQKTFPGAGHVPQISHPDDYMAAVREFIQNTR